MVSVVQTTNSSTHFTHAPLAKVNVQEKVAATKEIPKGTKSNLSSDDIEKITQELNSVAKKENLDISFGYDRDLKKVYINVVDKNSGEVIRKLPSEEAMKFAKSMKETVGKLLDKRG